VVDGEKPGPFFKHRDFTYDAERDLYVCPQGATLKSYGRHYGKQVRTYRASASACQGCPVRASCTTSAHGRTLRRHFDEDYRERARAHQGTEAYKKAMRKRAVWVEPLFGEAKDWHGLRRFRLRGRENVNIEGLRIAAEQNLKRYLTAKGWGRRLGPAGIFTAPHTPNSCPAPRPVLTAAQTAFFQQAARIVADEEYCYYVEFVVRAEDPGKPPGVQGKEYAMTYVISEPCIDVKDQSCVEVCPVDCIHPSSGEPDFDTERQLYIDPDVCIDCGACEPVCPVQAIRQDSDVPDEWKRYIQINADFFKR